MSSYQHTSNKSAKTDSLSKPKLQRESYRDNIPKNKIAKETHSGAEGQRDRGKGSVNRKIKLKRVTAYQRETVVKKRAELQEAMTSEPTSVSVVTGEGDRRLTQRTWLQP